MLSDGAGARWGWSGTVCGTEICVGWLWTLGFHTRLWRDLGLGGPDTPGLMEIVFRYGFRLDGIELVALVEVVGE